MFHWLDWVAIGTYVAFALGVGTYMARRASRSTQDFYLAGRSLPWYVAGTSIVATSFAADTPLVVTGWVRSAGISQNWLWWGMAGGGALSIIVLAAWWRRKGVHVRHNGLCVALDPSTSGWPSPWLLLLLPALLAAGC